jgi:hypothetical protein
MLGARETCKGVAVLLVVGWDVTASLTEVGPPSLPNTVVVAAQRTFVAQRVKHALCAIA